MHVLVVFILSLIVNVGFFIKIFFKYVSDPVIQVPNYFEE